MIAILSLTGLVAITTPARALTASSAGAVPAVVSAHAIFPTASGLRGCVRESIKSVTLSAAQLAQPRTGRKIARIPGLGNLISSFQERRGERLIMHYPAGDKGTLWAEELRAWLVALGVPGKRIALDPDLRHNDNSVTIAIQQQGEQAP